MQILGPSLAGTFQSDPISGRGAWRAACTALGRYSEAEDFYQRAISIRERSLGTEDPETANVWNVMADLYLRERQYGKAEQLLARVIRIWNAALGPDHTDMAAALTTLGLVYKEEFKFADAEVGLRQVLSICEKSLKPERPCVGPALCN
jgi:tetratricopeptide (TPR) repeat protein